MSADILTASVLCREALLAFIAAPRGNSAKAEWPAGAEPRNPRKGLFGLYLFVEITDLTMELDRFSEILLAPAIEAWAREIEIADLGSQFLALPLGVAGAANERYGGIAMRCVISVDHPVGERPLGSTPVPSHTARYYDICDDSMKEGPCATLITFWVHTPETTALMADGPK